MTRTEMERGFIYRSRQQDISVTVEPFYVPERSLPSRGVYFYAYSVTVTNHRHDSIIILRRKWVIRNGRGEEEKIVGDGVVGKTPQLLCGETFQYASFCPLTTPTGSMRGGYQVEISLEQKVWIPIPVFFLRTTNPFKPNDHPPCGQNQKQSDDHCQYDALSLVEAYNETSTNTQ